MRGNVLCSQEWANGAEEKDCHRSQKGLKKQKQPAIKFGKESLQICTGNEGE